jgi:hypothetical protein
VRRQRAESGRRITEESERRKRGKRREERQKRKADNRGEREEKGGGRGKSEGEKKNKPRELHQDLVGIKKVGLLLVVRFDAADVVPGGGRKDFH